MQFTAEEAFEASDCEEPIMITRAAAMRLVSEHDATWEEFEADNKGTGIGFNTFDAAHVLRWLGY
jgi:hypothetical protein